MEWYRSVFDLLHDVRHSLINRHDYFFKGYALVIELGMIIASTSFLKNLLTRKIHPLLASIVQNFKPYSFIRKTYKKPSSMQLKIIHTRSGNGSHHYGINGKAAADDDWLNFTPLYPSEREGNPKDFRWSRSK